MSRGPSNRNTEKYVGINNDQFGGMTSIGKIIRDAWVFGLIPETETCEGWPFSGLDVLMNKVEQEWDKYGCLVSGLPEELRERHKRIHEEAVKIAAEKGWDGNYEVSSDT